MVAARRISLASSLLVLGVLGCERRDPLAPSFAVSSAPAAPTNLTATAASYHQIWLAWEDNATNEKGFEVHRSTTGPAGTFTLFTIYPWPNTTAGGNDGLQASTEYCYKVRAYTTLGQSGKVRAYSGFSNTACVTTLGLPVPAAPSDVSAAPFWDRIRVTWTDNAANESGFRVERSATSSGPWTSVGTTFPNVVSFDDRQPPAAEQPACYRVFAYNSFGDSQGSDVDCTAAPNAPSGLVASATGSHVDLTWSDNSGIEDGYQVHRWTASFQFIVVATLPANTISYRDSGLPDDTYWYQVRATKDGGSSVGSNNASATVLTMPPVAPSGADALPSSSRIAVVTWVDNATNEAGFRVERSTDGGAGWVAAGTVAANEAWFYDVEQPSEQPLCYRVVAFNSLGQSPPSSADCTTLPLGPTNLTATPVDAQSIDLTWTDKSAVEDGYQVQLVYCWEDYYYGYYCDYYAIATLGPSATSYTLSGLAPGTNTYRVIAIKDGGYSDPSNEVSAGPTAQE